MENTYIISDYSNWVEKLTKQLNLPKEHVFTYQEWSEDFMFHDWVLENIQPQSKLLIPIELGHNKTSSVEGLRLAMHIRLMPNEIKYIPIILISNREDWQLRQLLRDSLDRNHLDYILDTKGVDFLRPNADEIKAVVENLIPLNRDSFKSHFYDHIHILPLEQDGSKHSLANIWGALRLNEVLNLNAITKSLTNRTKELYFKYLRAFHEEPKGTFKDLQSLSCKDKRVLLVDDEADKGWADVLKAIFKEADFQFIDFKNKSFTEAYAEAETRAKDDTWDLILLDLRLNPDKEDTGYKHIETAEYSGAQLLKAIKDYNKGLQVIMLTASNKAWNMKKLLDLGADGYYIKESPEFNFSPKITKENYDNLKDEAFTCFNAQYLKITFNDRKLIENHLKSIVRSGGGKGLEALNKLKMINEIIDIQLPQAFALLSLAKEDSKFFSLAFLAYFKILEIVNEYFVEYDEIQKKIKFKDNGDLLDEYWYDGMSKTYKKNTKNYWNPYKTSTPAKLYNVLFKRLGYDPQKDVSIAQNIYRKNKDRNDFIHPPDGLKSTKVFSSSDCEEISDLVKTILLKLS
ncbi:response regulator transcription factor [Runella zeae]|uniref:response regulator transcription factor n=1 Tax=Runella zeae TaxID=94255 RepID=UPI002352B349|nr:response regulator [Runella zeae]